MFSKIRNQITNPHSQCSVLQLRCSIGIAFSSLAHGVATIPRSKDFHVFLLSGTAQREGLENNLTKIKEPKMPKNRSFESD